MATIVRDIIIDAPPQTVWDAISDYGAVHERVAQDFVTATQLVEGGRIVTFANGLAATETLVTRDEDGRRLAYAITGGRPTHHNASFQVLAEGAGSRVVWIADLLPDALAPAIGEMMTAGAEAMRRTLSR